MPRLTTLLVVLAIGLVATGVAAQRAPDRPPPDPAPSAPAGAQVVPDAPFDEEPSPQPPAPAEAPPGAAPEAPATPELVDRSSGISAPADQARGYAEEPGVEAEDVVLFVPRVVLLAPGLLLDVAFWPLRQALIAVDRYYIIEHVDEVLYFDEAHEFGWAPTVSYQSGFGPTFGAKVFHDSLLDHGEQLEVSARYGGRYTQAYLLDFDGERVAGSRMWVEGRAGFEAEPGLLFAGYGFGGDGPGARLAPRETHQRAYFAQRRVLGVLRAGYTSGQVGGLIKPGLGLVANHRVFRPNDVDKTPIELVYDTSQIPGFDEGVDTLELQANLVVDLRRSRGLDSTGFYLESFAGGVPRLDEHRYFHYGAELSATLDLFRGTRLITLRTAIEAVEGRDAQIPFTDLPRLGGAHRLRGYRQDRFRDRRAALASVEYHYPIHNNVLGQLFVDAGGVSADYGDLYDLDDWKVGYGGGIIVGGENDITFRLDLSYGDDFQLFVSGDLARAFDGRSTQL